MRFQLGRLEFGRLDALVWAVTALTHAAGLVHDGNSGGGLTRRHVRSISGRVIVDPQGSRSAQH